MKDDLVLVYEADTLVEAQLLSQKLEEYGVESYIDHTGSPLDGLVAADQVKEVRVLPRDVDKAREVVGLFEAEHD